MARGLSAEGGVEGVDDGRLTSVRAHVYWDKKGHFIAQPSLLHKKS